MKSVIIWNVTVLINTAPPNIMNESYACMLPMISGSGMASGICADTNCLRVETRYPPGGTSPGSVSGNCSTDLGRDGWSTSFKHRRHSDDAIDLMHVLQQHADDVLSFLAQNRWIYLSLL